MSIRCNVVMDLIPLVKDGVASCESIELVNEHIESCESCQSEFELFSAIDVQRSVPQDEKVISSIKRRIFLTQLIVLISGAILGIALSNSIGMFYNLIIMPIIGGVAVLALNRKACLVPIFVFVLAYVWQTILGLTTNGFNWVSLSAGLYFSFIYAFLVCIGIVIAKLLIFAFEKEGVHDEK